MLRKRLHDLLRPWHWRLASLMPLPMRRHYLYATAVGLPGNFTHPRNFAEKVNWRILHDRRPIIAASCDKLRLKELARPRPRRGRPAHPRHLLGWHRPCRRPRPHRPAAVGAQAEPLQRRGRVRPRRAHPRLPDRRHPRLARERPRTAARRVGLLAGAAAAHRRGTHRVRRPRPEGLQVLRLRRRPPASSRSTPDATRASCPPRSTCPTGRCCP